jgi:hypothetical protein
MAYYYSFFTKFEGINRNQESLTCAMLGLIMNTIDYDNVFATNNELEGHCMISGFRPVYRILSSRDDILDIPDHPRTQYFLRLFGNGMRSFLDNRRQQVVMLGPILLTIGKNIQVAGYDGWVTNRLRAFMGTLGLLSEDIIWTANTYPEFSSMQHLGQFLSACHFLRREIFRIYWAASISRGVMSNVYKDAVNLLRGTNMTHILLIDEYLYSRYRELLSIRVLAENHKGMMAAWAYLASLHPTEVYYAKILFSKEETACLNRNNFPLHIPAAVAAARFETPSMQNYRGTETQIQSSTLLGNIVRVYLTKRLGLAPRAMINEMAQFGSHEVIEYQNITLTEKFDIVSESMGTQERGAPAYLPAPPGV